MTITACIAGHEYTGPTLAEIIDREYGDGAYASRYLDPNAAQWGQVLRNADMNSCFVLDTIYWVEGEDDVIDPGAAADELRDVARRITDLDDERSRLAEQRDELIRALLRAGLPVVDIARDGGVSRNQVYVIKKNR
ncbi:hypothetical protein [Corynebacterium sp. c8Ua_99]|uniref:hypothetical protein n=1 Tax=Corynebacterium sp. c8Ua_99 TaxID=3032335 RepID=UPI003265ECC9